VTDYLKKKVFCWNPVNPIKNQEQTLVENEEYQRQNAKHHRLVQQICPLLLTWGHGEFVYQREVPLHDRQNSSSVEKLAASKKCAADSVGKHVYLGSNRS
jgi:hypothetical protein